MISLKCSINPKEGKNRKKEKIYKANKKQIAKLKCNNINNHIKYRWSKHPHGLKMKNCKATYKKPTLNITQIYQK